MPSWFDGLMMMVMMPTLLMMMMMMMMVEMSNLAVLLVDLIVVGCTGDARNARTELADEGNPAK